MIPEEFCALNQYSSQPTSHWAEKDCEMLNVSLNVARRLVLLIFPASVERVVERGEEFGDRRGRLVAHV